jgi:type IV pilus assembly protein PilY1
MFHAVRESDGESLFAYVPNKIVPKLPKLTDPDYEHEFYVDGAPSYGDIQLANGTWKSVIASGLRAGGQGLFALDVTAPDTFGAANVLWEFTDEDDADLGYTFSQPQIKRMANGKWAVIIGNGLNNTEADGNASTTGTAALYILFIEDGRDGWDTNDWVKITVPGGSATNPNALFTPAAADLDGDEKVDVIYAGDRFGKVWKFDVRSSTPGSWTSAANRHLFFDAGVGSPVTDRPAVAAHPLGRSLGQLVTFGTGSYMEVADNVATGQPTQSIYAVWDFSDSYATANSITTANRYGHSRSEMSASSMTVNSGVRVMNGGSNVQWLDEDGGPEDYGWYVDLPVEGERMVRRPVLRDNLVFFVSMIPDDDPCAAGGTGWIMVMDAGTGQAPRFPVFDIDNDLDVTNEGDRLPGTEGVPGFVPVGVSSPSIPNLPALIYDDRPGFSASTAPFPPEPNAVRGCDAGSARAYTFTTGSNGAILAIETATESLSCGRQGWRGER